VRQKPCKVHNYTGPGFDNVLKQTVASLRKLGYFPMIRSGAVMCDRETIELFVGWSAILIFGVVLVLIQQ
jgi:hypothetical protein